MFYKLQPALLFREECFDVLLCLVVHDVYFGFKPFWGEAIKLHFVCVENAYVLKASYCRDQNCICFVMAQNKKQTLPSSKMNGNKPVKSLYITPFFLLLNAPKQKTFAIDSSSSNPIRLRLCNAPYAGPRYGGGCWKSGTTGGMRTRTTGMGAMPFFVVLGVVLRIPWRGLFMCPLAVARLGLRYLSIKFLLLFGQPVRTQCCVTLSSIENFGLHNDWRANLTAFAWVWTECMNTTIWACPDDGGFFLVCPLFPWC